MRVLSHLRSHAVAYVALFFALTGTAIAAKGLITGADIQDNSITGADVLESSLAKVGDADTLDGKTAADFQTSLAGQSCPNGEFVTAIDQSGDITCAAPEPPSPDADNDGYTLAEGDCDDTRATVYPGAPELDNGRDDDCDGLFDETFDADGDGYATSVQVLTGSPPGDCDDTRATVYPGAVELLNGLDDNCDGLVDEPFDADGDGYTTSGVTGNPQDCNDNDPAVHPGATEILGNGVDDNCDGIIA
jgi:Putative metal-binding motif